MNFSITAAEVRTTQRWQISFIANHILVLALAAYVSRWRVGANDKITSDTYESAQTLWASIFGRTNAALNSIISTTVISPNGEPPNLASKLS